MAHALSSNIALNLPTSRYVRPLLKPVRVMMGDAREKLHHLPTHNKPLPKTRLAPTAPIGLWERFPTARTVQEMMEEPFAFSTVEWPSSSLPSEGVDGYRRRGRAPWEIKESESEYKMRFDMPGMNKEDVKVWIEDKMLVVKAQKKMVEQDKQDEWSAKSYGRYSSRIALPDNVQFQNIEAEVKDGVLYVTIPKATSFSNILDIHVH
ncbi:Heat shock protein 21, chloroplastic, partial [Mucuna pruriens]